MLPIEFSSCLKVSVRAVTANLLAGYTFKFGKLSTLWPAMLFMCTMCPSTLFSLMFLTASLVAMHRPNTFKSKILFQTSVSPSTKFVPNPAPPALFIRMCTGPRFCFVHSKAFKISSSFVTSAVNGCSFPFFPSSFLASPSKFSTLLAKPTT